MWLLYLYLKCCVAFKATGSLIQGRQPTETLTLNFIHPPATSRIFSQLLWSKSQEESFVRHPSIIHVLFSGHKDIQTQLSPQQWCTGRNKITISANQFLLMCTNHDVTSAQSHAGNDTFIELHHIHALLQANQGYQHHSIQRGGCDDWLLGSLDHSSSLTPKPPLGESTAARARHCSPAWAVCAPSPWWHQGG